MSLQTILILGITTSVFAYYLTDRQGVFEWFMGPIRYRIIDTTTKALQAKLDKPGLKSAARKAAFWTWIFNGISCRICIGQHVAIWQWALLSSQWPWQFGRVGWFTVLAANGVHLILEDARILSVKWSNAPAEPPNLSDEA